VTLFHRENLGQTFDSPASGPFILACLSGKGSARGVLGVVFVALRGLRSAGLGGALCEDEEPGVAFTVWLVVGWGTTFLGG